MTEPETIADFITGRPVPDTGAEANRQAVERYLVTVKGFSRSDVAVDAPIVFTVSGQEYRSAADLVVSAGGVPALLIHCAAGSLGSRERETLAAARIFDPRRPVPLCAVSDGRTAIVMQTATGKTIGEDLEHLPDRDAAAGVAAQTPVRLPEGRLEKERLIFRSYDSMKVNRRVPPPGRSDAGNR